MARMGRRNESSERVMAWIEGGNQARRGGRGARFLLRVVAPQRAYLNDDSGFVMHGSTEQLPQKVTTPHRLNKRRRRFEPPQPRPELKILLQKRQV